ncbi:MAG TPA: phosphatase PAP2 family protein [Saprospiraceae bacterium]|nr:phosphatase PAP2 family protein [Saprospiraceae bacterium]
MWELLQHFDEALFHWVNRGWSSGIFDFWMPLVRNKYFWLPLYVFLIAYILMNRQKPWWFLFCIGVLILSSDTLSSKVFKPMFKRLRPCHNTELVVVQRVPCGSGYSFTSSHASNHFALSTFLFLALVGWPLWLRSLLILWALNVAIAQVYVGVHYPFDVIMGSVTGMAIGWVVYRYLFLKRSKTADELARIDR